MPVELRTFCVAGMMPICSWNPACGNCLLRSAARLGLSLTWFLRRILLKPMSKNGASTTGPKSLMRYSKLYTKRESPPGKFRRNTGTSVVSGTRSSTPSTNCTWVRAMPLSL